MRARDSPRGSRQIANVVFVVFMLGAAVLTRLVMVHQRVFDYAYQSVDACVNEMNRRLLSQLSGRRGSM